MATETQQTSTRTAEALVNSVLDRVRPGDILGGYQLLTPIARGGVGLVWAARRTGRLGIPQIVAVKTALSVANEQMEQLFFDEARVAASIDHPNVCRVYDLGEEQGVLYLAMDWIDGASLSNLIGAIPGRRLDPALAAYIVAEACSGLHAAHELRDEDGRALEVVHRDATPQNILLSSKGGVKVTDFGIVKARDQAHDATKTGEVKGKLSYFSPEQLLGKRCDRRVDVFALGAVLYLAVTGRDAFRESNAGATMLNILGGRFDPPSAVFPECPREMEGIILRALALNPEDRFATAADLRAALCEFIEQRGTPVGPEDISKVLAEHLGPALAHRRTKIRAAQEQFDSQGFSNRSVCSQSLEAPSTEGSLGSGRATGPVNSTPGAVAVDLARRNQTSLTRPTMWLSAATLVAIGVAATALWMGFTARDGREADPREVAQASLTSRVQAPSLSLVTVRIVAVPSSATLSTEDGAPSSGALELSAPEGQAKAVDVKADGYEPQRVFIAFDHSRTQVVRLNPIQPVRASRVSQGRTTQRRVPRGVERGPSGEPSDPFSLPQMQRPPRRPIDVSDPFEE